MKVVVDTNIWVSLAIGSKSITCDFFELLNSINIEFIVCERLIDEIVATLEKEKIRKYLSKDRVILLFDILENHTSSFISHSKNTFCRDLNDDYLINLAIDSESEILITGDKDLLILNSVENIKILTIKQLLDFIKKPS